MTQIIRFLKQNEKYCFGLSVAALSAYLLFRKKNNIKKHENLLQTNLHKLMASSRHPSIKKLVITSDPASKGELRRNLINYVKSRLIEQNIKVLINCSPQKLLKAGCQCFLDSMQKNDTDYTEYYYNALKTQYLVEDTISKIELINEHENNMPIVMICDNNSMDIKLMNDDPLWTSTLKRYDIKEEDIISGYDLILHIKEQDVDEASNARIKENWKKHPFYYQISSQKEKLREKYEQVYQIIRTFLEREKQRLVLAS